MKVAGRRRPDAALRNLRWVWRDAMLEVKGAVEPYGAVGGGIVKNPQDRIRLVQNRASAGIKAGT